MEMFRVSNRDEKITPNFNVKEVWNASKPKEEYDFALAFLLAGQILRDHYGCAFSITAAKSDTFKFGYHRLGSAIDYLPSNSIAHNGVLNGFRQECINYIEGKGSVLVTKLRKIGINGFGVECACIHFDIRPDKTSRTDEYGNYMVFEFKMDAKGNILVNRAL